MPTQGSSGGSNDLPLAEMARGFVDAARSGDRQAAASFATEITRQIDSREASGPRVYQTPAPTSQQSTIAQYARSATAGHQPAGPSGQQSSSTSQSASDELARRLVAEQIKKASSSAGRGRP
ncbi:hypothetical protein [Streptomyces niveus]|uniref:hypothetical protein n=1 Tax=Streptomyces niveus TaxID=193462 RepID=UPI00364ABAA5